MRIPGCPVIGRAVAVVSPTRRTRATPPPVPNRDKIILTGHGLDKARVNQQAEFVIDATGASPGKILLFTMLFIIIVRPIVTPRCERTFNKR